VAPDSVRAIRRRALPISGGARLLVVPMAGGGVPAAAASIPIPYLPTCANAYSREVGAPRLWRRRATPPLPHRLLSTAPRQAGGIPFTLPLELSVITDGFRCVPYHRLIGCNHPGGGRCG
jgi:hypothetical protein